MGFSTLKQGSRIFVAPFNDISEKLSQSLPEHIDFCGFVDSFKTGEHICKPESVHNYDFIIINSPNYWREIASNFECGKIYLYNTMGRELITYDEYIHIVEQQLFFDVLLLPFNKSNIQDLSIIARELKKINISAALVDVGSIHDNNIKEGLKENCDLPVVFKDQINSIHRRALLASIDWESGFGRPLLEKERVNGGLAIGIVDGIEDFEDADYDYERNAYNTVEYVLLMGKDDQSHLDYKRNDTSIVGLPKMWQLYREQSPLPKLPHVVINVNFTYGTFEEERDEWVNVAISSCEAVGLPYIISQHHADKGTFPKNIVSPNNVYDAIRSASIIISRFSTVILESLAMGRQVVYFNPHGETVKLYAEPKGAFHLAKNAQELIYCLQSAVDNPNYGKRQAFEFLERKCNISSTVPPGKLAAYRIQNLLDERTMLDLSSVQNYDIDPRYTSRKKYHHYNDQGAEDEWQLEVYLHGLGLLVKHKLTRIADVGCGSGFKLMTYFDNYQTIGYELPDNVTALQKCYPDNDWRISNFSVVDDIDTDIIICSDVIEHLVDPDELLLYLSRQSFRYLILSTPARELVYAEDDPARFGPPRNYSHQREWSFDEFSKYIARHFNVIDHRITNLHQATQMVICELK